MTKLEQGVTKAAREMSREARAELAHLLLAELGDDEQRAIDEAWTAEIGRRIQSMDRGQGATVPSDQVVARLRAKHSA